MILKLIMQILFILPLVLTQAHAASIQHQENATFAGGCFWSMTTAFENLDGVKEVVAGYTGGHTVKPSYEDVVTETTGHLESVQITYDPAKVTYDKLLQVYWRHINPTDDGGQFVDRGPSYRTAVFYHNEEQKTLAEKSKKDLDRSRRFDKPIVTAIRPAAPFYPAEEYHQHYAKKNPIQYQLYRTGSGRDRYFAKVWGKDEDSMHAVGEETCGCRVVKTVE